MPPMIPYTRYDALPRYYDVATTRVYANVLPMSARHALRCAAAALRCAAARSAMRTFMSYVNADDYAAAPRHS